MRFFILFSIVCLFSARLSHQDKVLSFEPSSLTVEVNKKDTVLVKLVEDQDKAIKINFTYGDENEEFAETCIIATIDQIELGPFSNQSRSIQIYARDVGHLVIGAKSNDTEIPFSDIFRVDVIHSKVLNIFIQIIGWIYFVAWSISFYPQVFLNFKIKEYSNFNKNLGLYRFSVFMRIVSGLSFDFTSLNFLGHSCYSVFNIAFYWIPEVQHQYFKKHPRGVNPVLLNDVLFSVHAVALTLITGIQCIVYKRAEQKISLLVKIMLLVMLGFLAISGIVCITTSLTVLTYIYFFSYVKLGITIMKYIPQAYINYKRKSTVGWSILNVLLDFTGGSLSLLQMFFLAYNYNDWTSIFGSPTKLGLGLLSIVFDLVFIFQHYVLYRSGPEASGAYTPIS